MLAKDSYLWLLAVQEPGGSREYSQLIEHSPGLSWPSWRVKVRRFAKRAHFWALGRELVAQAHWERIR